MKKGMILLIAALSMIWLCSAAKADEEKKDELPSWLKKISFKGDFRYRHEAIDAEATTDPAVTPQGKPHRNRHRIRFRLELNAEVNDNFSFKARLATGGTTDPTSTNQTLAGFFANTGFNLDKAYATWHPTTAKGFEVMAGKMGVPFYCPLGSQLFWDGDLTPGGIAMQYKSKSDSMEPWFTLGGFWLTESSSLTKDSGLIGLSTGLKYKMSDKKTYITAGIGYFDYQFIKYRSAFESGGSFQGNSYTVGNQYGWDYDLFEFFVEFGTKLGDYPVSACLDIAMNIGDTVLDDVVKNPAFGATYKKETTGYLFAIQFGKAKDFGTFDVALMYRQVGADAVVAAFNDSDFGGGGTGNSGVGMSIKMGLGKNASLGLTYMRCKTKISKNYDDTTNPIYTQYAKDLDYDRFQLDLGVKF